MTLVRKELDRIGQGDSPTRAGGRTQGVRRAAKTFSRYGNLTFEGLGGRGRAGPPVAWGGSPGADHLGRRHGCDGMGTDAGGRTLLQWPPLPIVLPDAWLSRHTSDTASAVPRAHSSERNQCSHHRRRTSSPVTSSSFSAAANRPPRPPVT